MMPEILKRDAKGKYGVMWEGEELKLNSVTNITGCAMKFGLLAFYGKHGTELAKEIANEAAEIGTDFHNYAEAYFRKGSEVKVRGDLRRVRNCISNFKKAVKHLGLVPYQMDGEPCLEMTVFSITHMYAGTFDGLFTTNDGKLVLLDWKTSTSIWEDYLLQLEAYYIALTEMAERGIIKLDRKIDELLILRFDKEGLVDFKKDLRFLTPGNKVRQQAFLGLNSYKIWSGTKKAER